MATLSQMVLDAVNCPTLLGVIGKQVEVYFLNVKGLEVEVKRTSHFENYTWFWFADGEKCGEFDLDDRFALCKEVLRGG